MTAAGSVLLIVGRKKQWKVARAGSWYSRSGRSTLNGCLLSRTESRPVGVCVTMKQKYLSKTCAIYTLGILKKKFGELEYLTVA